MRMDPFLLIRGFELVALLNAVSHMGHKDNVQCLSIVDDPLSLGREGFRSAPINSGHIVLSVGQNNNGEVILSVLADID